MGTNTTKLSLLKPNENDFYNQQTEQSDNWDKVDKFADDIQKNVDFNLLATLGIEYGGILNNTEAKVAGKAYYDTTGNKLFKCTANTSLNYADAGFFEAISNNDLLSKVTDLIEVIQVDGGWAKKYSNGILELYLERLFTKNADYTFPIPFADTGYVAVFTRSKMTTNTEYIYVHVNKTVSTKEKMRLYMSGAPSDASNFSFSAIICGRWK